VGTVELGLGELWGARLGQEGAKVSAVWRLDYVVGKIRERGKVVELI